MQRLVLVMAASLLLCLAPACTKREEPAPGAPFLGKPTAALVRRLGTNRRRGKGVWRPAIEEMLSTAFSA